ncbi:hypothetical protein P171DRAFT_478604 [Karstenula rhodostoma CBS 690.94]|uniref:Uncharacterized protein n=1 Tax=Karstenula rhodostoma CBS 690.94 TaxID=1392251 RepID=A0A9P4UJQ6_9PLEO|nr:hypothetical protein P171DRAFT_478604 [Karstenula rhodostoma CBS 690.94]
MTLRMYAAGELDVLSADAMSCQLAARLEGRVFQPIVLEILEAQAHIGGFLSQEALKRYEYKFVDAMERYIQTHDELSQVPKGGPFGDYHYKMASMVRSPFSDHVLNELIDFSTD